MIGRKSEGAWHEAAQQMAANVRGVGIFLDWRAAEERIHWEGQVGVEDAQYPYDEGAAGNAQEDVSVLGCCDLVVKGVVHVGEVDSG